MRKFISTLFLLVSALAMNPAMAAIVITASGSPSTTTINHPVAVSLSISNTGSQVTVTNLGLTATSTQSPTSSKLPIAVSIFNVGPNAPSIVLPANLTTSITAGQMIFFSPSTGITGSGSGTYSIGGVLYTSDGSITPVTKAGVITINPIPLPAYQRQ